MGEILAQLGQQNLLNSLLQQDPSQVHAWLKSILTGQQAVPEDFNWEALAYVAADKARRDDTLTSKSLNLEWAKVAISVYEFLALNQPNASEKESFNRSAMMLRAYMISKLGAIPGNVVLDSDRIVNWFFKNLKISPNEALTIAWSWQDLITHKHQDLTQNKQNFTFLMEKVQELRQIKNRLAAIALLSQSNQFNSNPEIGAWLSLQEKLP